MNVPFKLKKNEYSAIVGYNVLLMFIWASWLMVFSSIPLLILCLLILPITMRWLLKSPVIILDFFSSVKLCFVNFETLLSIYMFGLLHFLDELNFLLLYFVPISLAVFFVLKSSRFQIGFNRPIQDFFLINVLMKKSIGSRDFFFKQTTSLNSKWFSYSQVILGSFKKLLCESLDHLYVT